jgi:hypothetical protein
MDPQHWFKDLFIRKSWKFVPTTVEQCRGEMLTETEQRVLKEGCQVLFSFWWPF